MTQQAHGTFPPALDGLKLKRGTGKRDYDAEGMAQVCIMQAVAWFAGEENTDRPQCACEALTSYMIRLNDKMSDEMRQKLKPFIPRLVGTRSTPEIRKQRAQFLAQVAINEFAPNALRSAAKNLGKYPEHAAKLEDFAKQSFMEAQDLPSRAALGLLASGGEMITRRKELSHAYKTGTLEFDENSLEVANMRMVPVNEIRKFHDRFESFRRQPAFLNALIIMTSDKHYEHERFMRNLGLNISSVVYCTSVAKYLSLLEGIYNYRRKDGTRVNLTTRGISFIRTEEHPPQEN